VASTSVRTAARPTRRADQKVAPKRADLKIVRTEDRVRTVGAISTAVASFFFVVLFALAGLHAVVVQTQADLDEVNADITSLEERRVVRQADLAWADSAVGLEVTALAAGLVPAGDTVILAPLPPGELTQPKSIDPFVPGSPAVAGGTATLARISAGTPG
jgi:hypothetical protein